MDQLRALWMLLRLGKLGPVPREESVTRPEGPCVIYAAEGKQHGVVVMIHGMSPLAETDPRWVQLARGFARAGLTVYTPHIASVAALRIEAAQIDAAEGWVVRIAEEVDQRVALFSVSFSGSVTLLAAARPSVRERISAVCTLGAFGAVSETLRYLFTDPGSDPYGRLIVLGNFIWRVVDDPEDWLRRALLGHAEDNFNTVPPRLSPADLPPPLDGVLTELLTDPQARTRYWEAVDAGGLPEISALNAIAHVGSLAAPVTLIHGIDDTVIPAEQSRLLHAAIAAVGLPVELVVTPLLSHGDAQVSLWTTLRHAPALTGAFGAFIRRARAG